MTARAQDPPEWYRRWFGEEYLALYPHRDQEEAQDAVELVLRTLGSPAGRVLDLASGAGRHLFEFRARGLWAVGLDLSTPLLARARADGPELLLVRGDMRSLPFADASFDLAVNFFTSFGYFADSDEDRRVLEELQRVLAPEAGGFALDFLNAERVRSTLVDRDERELNGKRVVQERHLEEGGKVVVKHIQILDPSDGRLVGTFQERVRLYSAGELEEMLVAAGLESERRFGDYAGSEFREDSPRLILMGHSR